VPLLDLLSDATRATSTFVLPGEDVEVKVAQVFRRLFGPVLADLALEVRDGAGAVTTRAIRELMPERLPDLFAGDQLVLLGQYSEPGRPLDFRLHGSFLGEPRTFAFRFDLDRATTRNAFVPRLWATRRIAFLVDQIRQAGASPGYREPSFGNGLLHPCFNELSAEILRLSTEFGILSEHTAFLATEGTDLGDWDRLRSACDSNLHARAVLERCGEAAVSQGRNFNDAKQQAQLNYRNSFWNEKNERVAFAAVQQVCDRAFFQRGQQWIDARLVSARAALEPQRVVDFGSPEHRAILERLVAEGRQGLLSLRGEILLELQGEKVLIKNEAR
jgi:Ca-activated chloride channel family protein